MRNSWRHFLRRIVATCAVSGATAWSSAMCYASAFDVATNPQYADGWQAGDNGGTGFGAWSFNGTDSNPAGIYQAMSSSSPIGTAWTLATHANNSGLANAGRAITGGLLSGQTFSTTIDNPTTYHFYRGFDILFTSGSDNNGPGNNTAALRVSVFNYFGDNWKLNDTVSTDTGLSSSITGEAGMRLALTLTSATAYSITLTPLNGDPAYTHAGTLAGPISWVDYRLWDGTSTGPEDTDNNFEISNMSIVLAGVPGDYNNNGVVDAADYVLWRKGGPLQNEVDTPGTVNAADYTAWRARFGNTSGAGSGALSSAVPEPGMIATLLAALGPLCAGSFRSLLRFGRSGRESR